MHEATIELEDAKPGLLATITFPEMEEGHANAIAAQLGALFSDQQKSKSPRTRNTRITAKPARWLFVACVTTATMNGAMNAVAFPVSV